MTKVTIDRVQALATISYLKELPPAELKALACVCAVRHVPKGARAFIEGDAPSGIFLILSGRIKLVRSSPDGREQVLHAETPGATLGEVPVFDGGGWVGSAVAADDSQLLFVPRAALLDVLERHPAASREVIRVLGLRVRQFARLVEDLSLRPITGRVAGYLVREMVRTGEALVQMPDTRDQLATYLGTGREQVSRALSQLKRDGLIAVAGRRVRILDPARLRALAGSRSY